ncbi:MAG: hypothetical protein CH6_0227 [Candidatus Kapaibacterium sp.]|nr:MAG: hypothetical protein CH6_0227 [Candidatus Kapabacteria bacterium]
MTINFYLNNAIRNGEKPIFCYIRGIKPKKTLVLHTGEYINPKHWDSAKQQAKRSYPFSTELNQFLLNFKEKVKNAYRKAFVDFENPSYEDIVKTIKEAFVKYSKKAKGFFDIYDEFLQIRVDYSASMIKKFKIIRKYLNDFDPELSFNDINASFYDRFLAYLFSKGLSDNTAYKYIKILKTFLNWAVSRGYTDNTAYKSFKAKVQKADIITLSEDELMRLYTLKLDNKRLERIRDVFCFGCFTGQRFSDIVNLKKNDIKDNTWYLRVVKTKELNLIPLNDFALSILEKYKDLPGLKALPSISNQKMNAYLKELCQLAGIDEMVTLTRYQGSKKIEISQPKYNLVSSHTARRTFVTLSLQKGMRPEVVMQITGHKDLKSFSRYIEITTRVKAQEMRKIWKIPFAETVLKN